MENYAKAAVDMGVVTDYFFVEDYISEVLEFFQLSKEALGKGLNYSNHELVSIYLCQTDYLVFYTGDTRLDQKVDWIQPSIDALEKNGNYKVANPVWNEKYDEALKESDLRDREFLCWFRFFRPMLPSPNKRLQSAHIQRNEPCFR